MSYKKMPGIAPGIFVSGCWTCGDYEIAIASKLNWPNDFGHFNRAL
jgi:hypothetical protein